LRHKKLVERETTVTKFAVAPEASGAQYPLQATLRNKRTGAEETVRAKFLIGSDGAAITIRKQLQILFNGVSTDIYWGILDGVFESDYPHAWVFGYGALLDLAQPPRACS
jgi:phenol 2-monooxygenase (NADPH)